MKLSLVAALAASASASSSFTEDATVESSSSAANPIRKVVTLLKKMEQKVTAEGEKEAAMYKKYECYCKNAGSDLSKSISDSDAKIPEVASSIKEGEEQKVQLEQELTKHRADREAAKAAMADATAIREKESAAFAKLDAEYTANIDAVTKAANAVDGGMSGGFLQTSAGSLLMRIVQSQQDMVDVDRQDVMAFFQGDESYGYAPQSGQISGILKGLADDMSKDRAEARDQEKGSVKVYGELMAAKTKEVQACTDAIESKTVRVGELAVSIVNMKNDLSDTQAALLEDQKFLGDLEGNCANRAKEYDVVVQTRSEELAALAEVIKLLQDDDALELFKKTLPSASSSFVQQTNSFASVQKSALATIRAAQKLSPHVHQQLDFITLALQGRKVSFDKVIKMIDEMTALLKEEQVSDDNKKEYCSIQMDSMDDKKKGLERSSADSETAIESAKEDIATLTSEIKALEEGIKNLDKSVMEASEQRKEEHEEYSELMASNSAAKELIGIAKNRLNKFYNPKIYNPGPKRELSREDRIAVNMGGTAPPTPAPGGIGGTGVAVLAQIRTHTNPFVSFVAPPPPPEAVAAYSKKSGEATGSIGMMDLLVKDLDKEMAVAETEEKDAQADYETMTVDAAKKRAEDSRSLATKSSTKADTEEELQLHTDKKQSADKELMATMEYIQSLHTECDWLLQYFDMRKEARTGEIDSLTKAKAVLSGADFSLVQQKSRPGLRGAH